jgi:hypothetical protein
MNLNIGIDVAKNVHEACLVNENGEQIGKFIRLKNSKKSIKFTFTIHPRSVGLHQSISENQNQLKETIEAELASDISRLNGKSFFGFDQSLVNCIYVCSTIGFQV